jgi:hypothetical protein
MRIVFRQVVSVMLLTIVIAGCGGVSVTPPIDNTDPVPTPTVGALSTPVSGENPSQASLTPDPCSSGQIEAEVQKVHRHMREFDDASILAANLPREELSDPIANLQRIRREAEDEQIPACLTDLKNHQVDHMNSVISTLVAFIGGADTTALEQGIQIARDQHDLYTLELGRLLGLTVVPATVPVISTPDATATP